MKQSEKTRANVLYIAQAGVIAAIYVVLTLFISAFSLASGNIQFRISEALCVLPFFTPAAIPGLTIGCFLANLFMGSPALDVIFGTLATLIAAAISYKLKDGKFGKFMVTVPPVIANALIIPFVIYYGYVGNKGIFVVKGIDLTIPFFAVTIGAGEILAVCVLGSILLHALLPVRKYIFK